MEDTERICGRNQVNWHLSQLIFLENVVLVTEFPAHQNRGRKGVREYQVRVNLE